MNHHRSTDTVRRLPIGCLLLLLAFVLPPARVAGQDTTSTRLYDEAVTEAQGGRMEKAVEMMEAVAAREPAIPNVQWNLGLWYAQLQKPAKALTAWQAYRRLEPDDWRVRAKLIQTYQALGDTAQRDRERAALLELRRSGTDAELARQAEYCREQFRVGTQHVMAFETFKPEGERRVYYTFYLPGPDGRPRGRYSLGSYDQTTQIARGVGEIGKDERLYHLDWYAERAHATYEFYRALPGYEKVRDDVVAAITGAKRPVSSTRSR
jgi:tetratricopeptide (TPR) repeat protein